ncbi:unnamed protein product [Protopolystoma xenopodis]|uniref:Uncharacterized protein n=1 Tax=Protopolystoma xenopodis TaxID=117903 RepID=A0A3S5A9A1_9PLAT|nr:unnamed protein product [Protopolystoma xenopodis]
MNIQPIRASIPTSLGYLTGLTNCGKSDSTIRLASDSGMASSSPLASWATTTATGYQNLSASVIKSGRESAIRGSVSRPRPGPPGPALLKPKRTKSEFNFNY